MRVSAHSAGGYTEGSQAQANHGGGGSPLWVRNWQDESPLRQCTWRGLETCGHEWTEACAHAHAQGQGQGQTTHLCPRALQHAVTYPGQHKYARHVPGCTHARRLHMAASTRSFTLKPWHQHKQLEKNAPVPTLPPSKQHPLPPFCPPSFLPSSPNQCFSWGHQPLSRPENYPLPLAHAFTDLLSTQEAIFFLNKRVRGALYPR